MSVKNNAVNQRNAEEKGQELELACVRYNGQRSMVNTNATRTQGGYPAYSAFNRGVWELVMLPTGKLGWWESHADFEIDYSKQQIARVLVAQNSLPEQVFGPGYDAMIRNRIFEYLGLQPSMTNSEYYEQLNAIAYPEGDAPEAPAEQEDEVDSTFRSALTDLTRNKLIKLAGEFDHDFDNLSGATKTELIDFLVGCDRDAVMVAIEEHKISVPGLSVGGKPKKNTGGKK